MRRALKQLIYDDLKLCNFQQMVGETYSLVTTRFVMDDDEEKDVTADDFFCMTCGQVLQKLVKQAQSKIRSKDMGCVSR